MLPLYQPENGDTERATSLYEFFLDETKLTKHLQHLLTHPLGTPSASELIKHFVRACAQNGSSASFALPQNSGIKDADFAFVVLENYNELGYQSMAFAVRVVKEMLWSLEDMEKQLSAPTLKRVLCEAAQFEKENPVFTSSVLRWPLRTFMHDCSSTNNIRPLYDTTYSVFNDRNRTEIRLKNWRKAQQEVEQLIQTPQNTKEYPQNLAKANQELASFEVLLPHFHAKNALKDWITANEKFLLAYSTKEETLIHFCLLSSMFDFAEYCFFFNDIDNALAYFRKVIQILENDIKLFSNLSLELKELQKFGQIDEEKLNIFISLCSKSSMPTPPKQIPSKTNKCAFCSSERIEKALREKNLPEMELIFAHDNIITSLDSCIDFDYRCSIGNAFPSLFALNFIKYHSRNQSVNSLFSFLRHKSDSYGLEQFFDVFLTSLAMTILAIKDNTCSHTVFSLNDIQTMFFDVVSFCLSVFDPSFTISKKREIGLLFSDNSELLKKISSANTQDFNLLSINEFKGFFELISTNSVEKFLAKIESIKSGDNVFFERFLAIRAKAYFDRKDYQSCRSLHQHMINCDEKTQIAFSNSIYSSIKVKIAENQPVKSTLAEIENAITIIQPKRSALRAIFGFLVSLRQWDRMDSVCRTLKKSVIDLQSKNRSHFTLDKRYVALCDFGFHFASLSNFIEENTHNLLHGLIGPEMLLSFNNLLENVISLWKNYSSIWSGILENVFEATALKLFASVIAGFLYSGIGFISGKNTFYDIDMSGNSEKISSNDLFVYDNVSEFEVNLKIMGPISQNIAKYTTNTPLHLKEYFDMFFETLKSICDKSADSLWASALGEAYYNKREYKSALKYYLLSSTLDAFPSEYFSLVFHRVLNCLSITYPIAAVVGYQFCDKYDEKTRIGNAIRVFKTIPNSTLSLSEDDFPFYGHLFELPLIEFIVDAFSTKCLNEQKHKLLMLICSLPQINENENRTKLISELNQSYLSLIENMYLKKEL